MLHAHQVTVNLPHAMAKDLAKSHDVLIVHHCKTHADHIVNHK